VKCVQITKNQSNQRLNYKKHKVKEFLEKSRELKNLLMGNLLSLIEKLKH